MTQTKIDLIWNITRICPWDCAICCVDAHVVRASNDVIRVHSNEKSFELADDGEASAYDQVLKSLQAEGVELSYEEKLGVVDGLAGLNARVDFSGGDPLCVSDTVDVMSYCATKIGRENITLTATGPGLKNVDVEQVGPLIAELNFTYDSPSGVGKVSRPRSYARSNLLNVAGFKRFGVKLRAEYPLTTLNCDASSVRSIYEDLHLAGVDTVLLMRLFPVGRGQSSTELTPSNDQYRQTIAELRKLETELGSPKVKLQCALRFFDDPSVQPNPCDLVTSSFGLMPDGTLLASAWAYNFRGAPLGREWVLGNLREKNLSEIVETGELSQFFERADENFGHCKVFAWLNGGSDGRNSLFEATDPLLR